MKNILRDRRFYSPAVAAVTAVLFVSFTAAATTTISTDISTGGTLTVTGVTTLGANVTVPAGYSLDVAAAGALNIGTTTATSITVGSSGTPTRFVGQLQASSTVLLTNGLTAYASSTLQATSLGGRALFLDALQASSTVLLTNGLTAYASSTLQATTIGGASTHLGSALFTGALQASSTALFTSGLTTYASSTLQTTTIGGGTALAGINAGYCNIVDAAITATTTATFACTGTDATKVASGDRVFVMATSSLSMADFYVQSANSTTTAGTIEVNIFYNGREAATLSPGAISLSFWATR